MLYVSDLDKTLLRSNLTLSDFTKEVWNKKAKSALMSIATARSLKKSLEFLDALELNAPLVLLDGAMVATKHKEILDLKALNYQKSKEILEFSSSFGIQPFIVGLEGEEANERFLYPKELNAFQQQLITTYKNDSRLQAKSKILPLQYNLKMVYMGNETEIKSLECALKKEFGSTIEIKCQKDVYFDCYFLTILHPDGDKAHALKKVLKLTNHTKEELTTFGDSHNDIRMFNLASTSVAVANACDELKSIATHTLEKTNDEDGVAHYLLEN